MLELSSQVDAEWVPPPSRSASVPRLRTLQIKPGLPVIPDPSAKMQILQNVSFPKKCSSRFDLEGRRSRCWLEPWLRRWARAAPGPGLGRDGGRDAGSWQTPSSDGAKGNE